MEGSEGSPPTSLWMIRAAELFPKPTMEREDEKLTVPFLELAGESVKYLGRTDDGVLALSNYRLFLLKTSTNSETSVPLGLIESAQTRDLFHLVISCKDASTVKCSFPTSEQCSEWQRRITLSVGVPENLESLFAFPFYAWVTELGVIDSNEWAGRLQRSGRFELDFRKEVDRLQFDVNGTWRISEANVDFKLCPSYPKLLLVPCCISDETLLNVASFRSSRRIPAVVWRHKLSGAVIARCSQPEVGWLGWRNSKDEQLLKALADACAFDRGEQSRRQNLNASGESTPSSAEGSHEEVSLDEVRKVLIVDARSYTSAVTNRARGGGCECAEYYPCAEIQFMSLGNIHAIRKSFHALRQLCASPPDIPNWLGLLERTMWLQHMSGLLAASMTVCHAIERNGRPVLVHCSDGWDRTPQIVATAQLCLDPYYRTVEGFRTLVEREWLSFGHKYADRCGHGPGSDELNERCPVFLQWLDLVYQIHRQFPCSFEFSVAYLIKLAQHSHSCLFGTFLCNTIKERIENSVFDRTFSVWPFLSGPMYRNPLYVPNKEKVLWPAHNVRDLVLWSEVYLGSLGNQNSSDFPPSTNEGNQESMSPMTKTRSYGDLITAGGLQNGLTRRSSDPNMTVDSNLMTPLQYSTENSVIDSSSDRGASPDLSQSLANIIHDTTEKLQNLTNELNQSDEDAEICKINNIDESKSCDFLTQQKHDKNIKIENNLNDFNEYDNINVVDNDLLKTESSLLFNKTTELETNMEMQMKMQLQTINNTNKNQINSIHDDDNDYLSNENGLNINLNQTENIAYGRRMDSEDYVDGCLYDTDANNMDNMMQSIDLKGSVINESPATSFCQSQNHSHGSVDTSTETLVPMEHSNQQQMQLSASDNITGICTADIININDSHNLTKDPLDVSDKTLTNSLCNDLNTEVHSIRSKPQQLQQQQQQIKNNFNLSAMDESILIQPEHQKLEISNNGKCDSIINSIINTTSSHRRRRTSSINSKNDVISPNKIINGSPSPSATSSRFLIQGARSLPLTPPGAPDRPSVAISCPDGLAHALSEQNIRLQQIVYEHKLREDALQRELHGMRMALLKKTCPHCSNQQIVTDEHGDDVFVKRSNQFVGLCNCDSSCVCPTKWFGEGSYFEDSYPNLATNALDNIENSSTCSWEAVEDRIGPTSTGASSTLPGGSVLWVPDHAVSRCTGCTTEFWLGRRKHHCRSCGQIFCADCSEFWAPLPDERLYTPVRLCGPCYHAVTTRIQQQSRSTITSNVPQTNNINNSSKNQKSTIATIHTPPLSSSSSSSSVALIATPVTLHPSSGSGNCTTTATASAPSSVTTATTSMEACKHAANPAHNDRNHLKATAASN